MAVDGESSLLLLSVPFTTLSATRETTVRFITAQFVRESCLSNTPRPLITLETYVQDLRNLVLTIRADNGIYTQRQYPGCTWLHSDTDWSYSRVHTDWLTQRSESISECSSNASVQENTDPDIHHICRKLPVEDLEKRTEKSSQKYR